LGSKLSKAILQTKKQSLSQMLILFQFTGLRGEVFQASVAPQVKAAVPLFVAIFEVLPPRLFQNLLISETKSGPDHRLT
jgi:hypothetical protein